MKVAFIINFYQKKSLVCGTEKSADGRKTQKERITINACSNASGTIKLPLFFFW